FASILWKDGSRAPEAAELMKITAGELLNMGVIDKVIPEHGYFSSEIADMLKENLIKEVAYLNQLPLEQLLEERYERFRKY
ncbi:acetyl-CoA carboxylase carboxyl transferase subunit alpha, partial [Streptococcus pluranimalium]